MIYFFTFNLHAGGSKLTSLIYQNQKHDQTTRTNEMRKNSNFHRNKFEFDSRYPLKPIIVFRIGAIKKRFFCSVKEGESKFLLTIDTWLGSWLLSASLYCHSAWQSASISGTLSYWIWIIWAIFRPVMSVSFVFLNFVHTFLYQLYYSFCK